MTLTFLPIEDPMPAAETNNGWRTGMDGAPKDTIPPRASPHEFLAVRCGWRIICWWNDDRYAKKPRPYWTGTDAFRGIAHMRDNAPTHWQPLPEPPK